LRHGEALKQRSRLFVSIFADAQDNDDSFYGAGTEYLRELYPYVERAITDNALTARNWIDRFGIPEEFFCPVYGLIPNTHNSTVNPSVRDHVLWAGRLDSGKRLDIVYEIARLSPEIHFDIYGNEIIEKIPSVIGALKNLPNVSLQGKYDGFFSLPTEKYFAFLYTTQCDGLPNVLLEATAAGLPVAAPDRGGIRDFVTNDTGWLVPRHTDAQAYVQILKKIREEPLEARTRWERAHVLLATRHSAKTFSRALFSAYCAENSPLAEFQ
jgi:glycosyltransferase involved in cell wall biosynthesis